MCTTIGSPVRSNDMALPIQAAGLQRTFDDIVAVDGVDLEVTEGEIFGFLGPNGAGKSTTVRMLTTLLRPTGGSATVAGYDVVTEADMVRRSIGVALQDAAIDPLMTGNELLRLQATLHGIGRTEARRRSGELLERVGLTAAGDRRVGGYSGGMRRRLDLALSLVHSPQVLFLDEPTTGLDPMSRIALWQEVRSLNEERGTTVLLTTQYLEEADQLAGRIAIIDHGRIVREGAPSVLKTQVGAPTLVVRIDAGHRDAARAMLAEKFGAERPAPGSDEVAIGLQGGAGAMADVVRALDDMGALIEHLELAEPSLDDVFAEATGRRLEGAASGDESTDSVSSDSATSDSATSDSAAPGSAASDGAASDGGASDGDARPHGEDVPTGRRWVRRR
jgi:ABC-2 type transport system ATP-binding protein